MGSKARGSGSGRRSDLIRGLSSMDQQRGDLKKAGRRRRFGEEGGGNGARQQRHSLPFLSLIGGARAWRCGGSSAKRGGSAERMDARVSYHVFIFVSACFGTAERPWRPMPRLSI